MTSASPWHTSIIASVAMNGGIPKIETLNPLTNPISPPNSTAPITPTTIGSPLFVIRTPEMTAHSAIPVPIDRSIPPVMITNVVPSASSPITTVEKRIAVTLL